MLAIDKEIQDPLATTQYEPLSRLTSGWHKILIRLKTAIRVGSILSAMENQPTGRMVSPEPWLAYGLLFLLALLLRLSCFTGLIASDDLGYAMYAGRIMDGSYHPELHHFAVRYGVIIPVGLIYKAFGVNEWTTVLFPLLASSAAPPLILALGRYLVGFHASMVAALLLTTFPVELRYASTLVPEPILQTSLAIGALLFVAAERKSAIWLGVLSGAAMGASYLVKEPAAFFAIAFVLFAVFNGQWWLALAVGGGAALVVSVEHLWYFAKTADLFFRQHAIAVQSQAIGPDFFNQALSWRLWKAYPRMMLIPNEDFGLHSVFAITLSAISLIYWRERSRLLLMLWAVVPFLYLNFGTSNFHSYLAIPMAPRYISPVYVPLFLLAGTVLEKWSRGERWRVALSMVVVITVCAVGVCFGFATRKTGYFTQDVESLRAIAQRVRAEKSSVCQFVGDKAERWRRTLIILDADVIDCSAHTRFRVSPDAHGLPSIRAAN
jgi:4-amino-4-deoxy-L-arabinose transferase-like glycosyltransferase